MRFGFPEKAKPVAVPTKEGVGSEDEEYFFPVLDATSKKDKPEAIGVRNGRLFDLAVEDNQLLPEQSIFGDEVGSTACQVGGRAENQ